MASSFQGSSARKLDEDTTDSEPSMEDILASIRQIISEDENDDDGLSERERYTHPTDPSNVNIPLSDDQLSAGSPPAKTDVKPQLSQEERAAKVRAQLAARHEASPSKSGIKALRDSGVKLKTEALAEKFEREAKAPAPVASQAEQPVLAATPPIPRYVATTQPISAPSVAAPNVVVEQMAANLMREKGPEIEAMLGDMMRPIVRKWLGDNLPTLVERLVREEIERVSRGRQAS